MFPDSGHEFKSFVLGLVMVTMHSIFLRAAVMMGGICAVMLSGVLVIGQILPTAPEMAYVSDRDGDFEIYRLDTGRNVEIQLTYNHEQDWQPVWSPDGSRILFTSQRDGNAEIYVMNADGSGVEPLTDHLAADFSPSWSPDGNEILFTSERYGTLEIMVMKADGSNLRRLTQNEDADSLPVWSPDGQSIAFVSERDGRVDSHIYLMDSDGQHVRRVVATAGNESAPSWSPDGRLLYVTDWENFAIRLVALDDSSPTLTLASNTRRLYFNPVISPDGRWLTYAFFSGDRQSDVYVLDMACVLSAAGCPVYRLTSYPGINSWPNWKP